MPRAAAALHARRCGVSCVTRGRLRRFQRRHGAQGPVLRHRPQSRLSWQSIVGPMYTRSC
eukprot:1262533-Pyramimonas_sp.AAC.1